MSHSIEWDGGIGATIRYTGRINADELASAHAMLTSDPRFDDLRYTLTDFRGANGHDLDLQDAATLSTPFAILIGASHTNSNMHAAFVVRDEQMAQLVQRSLDLHLYPYPAQIFESENEAREWLISVSGTFRHLELPP